MILSYFEPDHQIIWILLIENPVNVAAVADVVKFDSGSIVNTILILGSRKLGIIFLHLVKMLHTIGADTENKVCQFHLNYYPFILHPTVI